jgi:DNA-binding NtrC family response regulator
MYEQSNHGQNVSQMHALAFIYDHLSDFPSWVQRLTPRQVEQLATILSRWAGSNGQHEPVQPMEDVEKREFTRALAVCHGDVCEAAKALGIGKTTFYRRLKHWGYNPSTWRAISQAAALADVHPVSDFHRAAARTARAV